MGHPKVKGEMCRLRWVLQAEGDKVTSGVGFVAPKGSCPSPVVCP